MIQRFFFVLSYQGTYTSMQQEWNGEEEPPYACVDATNHVAPCTCTIVDAREQVRARRCSGCSARCALAPRRAITIPLLSTLQSVRRWSRGMVEKNVRLPRTVHTVGKIIGLTQKSCITYKFVSDTIVYQKASHGKQRKKLFERDKKMIYPMESLKIHLCLLFNKHRKNQGQFF